jgi:hypothetical protein
MSTAPVTAAPVTQQAGETTTRPRRQRKYRGKNKSTENQVGDNVHEKSTENPPSDSKNEGTTTRTTGRRGPRQSHTTRTAPEVAAEPREPREPIQPVDGLLELRISNAKPRGAYGRIIRLYLSGVDSAGRKLETGEVQRVQLTALGGAIGSAIYISDELVKGNVCSSASVETEFAQVEARKAPKITIVLERLSSWVSTEDAVLQKDKAYRKSQGEEPSDQPTA